MDWFKKKSWEAPYFVGRSLVSWFHMFPPFDWYTNQLLETLEALPLFCACG